MSDFDSALKIRQSDKTQLAATVYGAGAAGAPDSGVMTVQGIASMTPLLVSNVDADVSGVPLGTSALNAFGTQAAVAANTAAAAAIATAAVPATKTAYVKGFKGTASGLAKFELLSGADLTGAAIAAPIFTTTADPTHMTTFPVPIPVAGGVGGTSILIKGTNREAASAQDLYGSIYAYVTN